MNKRVLLFIIALFSITFIVIDKLFDEGLPKLIVNIIFAITGAYSVLTNLFSDTRHVKLLNHKLRKLYVFEVLIGKENKIISKDSGAFYKFKSNLLLFTITQLEIKKGVIENPEIFNGAFPLNDEFIRGTKPVNQLKGWQEYLNDQFVIITGKSGSGKTFELLKRLEFFCEKLKPGLQRHEFLRRKKIPLFIELKSLDTIFDEDWIINYVRKSAEIANFQIDLEQLRKLIDDGEVVYFFDGLDEVNQIYRFECIQSIISFSQKTGVLFSCRKIIFEELKRDISANDLPAEFCLHAMSKEWIHRIIISLENHSDFEKYEMSEFISNKPKLLENLSRPIILNLFINVYHRLNSKEREILEDADVKKTMHLLWKNYESHITKKKLPPNTDVIKMKSVTVWLAKIMGQKSFFIESIQPFWLKRINQENEIVDFEGLQKLYYIFTRILASMVVGLGLGCIISTPTSLLPNSILGGITITLIAGLYHKKPLLHKLNNNVSRMLLWLSMIISLILVCGLYQGLIVPRADSEMVFPFFSYTESWSGVLLGITLSTIFSYRVLWEKVKEKGSYILPIELFNFNWSHAIKYGLFWGTISGGIVGGIALFIKIVYPNTIFINDWLIPYLKRLMNQIGVIENVDESINIIVFCYAFLTTLIVASTILIILAGRYGDERELNLEKKQKLNYGIRQSLKHALLHSTKIGFLTLVVYYLVMILPSGGSWLFCIKISFGMFVLAFLWYGGMEVINHIILRVNLYYRGIAPLDYTKWVQNQQDMGFIIPTGYQMKFYHPSLAEYFIECEVDTNNKRVVSKDIATYIIFFLLFLFAILFPFITRYSSESYSKSEYDIETNFKNISKTSDNTYLIQNGGYYNLKVDNYINVGTFVGYVSPQGTKYGFMGMPLDSAYNIKGLGSFNHGALLYRVKSEGDVWSKYEYTENDTLKFKKGDELEFIINDKEYQNNKGRFKVELIPLNN